MTSTTHIRLSCGCLHLAVALLLAACGNGGGDGYDAESPRIVVLDGERFGSIQALAEAAASEHGALGEGEVVLYRLRGSAGTAAIAQAEQLRALGFPHVEAE